MGSPFHSLAAHVLEWMAKEGARSYIAGPAITDALRVCREDQTAGHRFIICPWDHPRDDASAVFRSYDEALESAGADRMTSMYLSIKLPSLRYDRARTEALVEKAYRFGMRIHFDALTPESVDRTFDILTSLRSRYPNIGTTIPSRWKRSCADIDRALDLDIPIRLVKGQLPDKREAEVEPCAGFRGLAERARRSQKTIGIATHDPTLAQFAADTLREAGVPRELEQLYRLRPLPERIRSLAPVRLYVPYGHGYPPYDIFEAVKKPRLGLRLLGDFGRGFMRGLPLLRQEACLNSPK